MLLGLVQNKNMDVALVINTDDKTIPYKVVFNSLLPSDSMESMIFYPKGYLKTKNNNPNFPDDMPENINYKISHDMNYFDIRNDYVSNGEFLVIYKIKDEYYKFTFELDNNKLIKVNDKDINFVNNFCWFNKFDENIDCKLKISKYKSINSILNVKQSKDLNCILIVKKINNLDIKSNIKVTNFSNKYSKLIVGRKANQIKNRIYIRRFDKKDTKSKIFIMGAGKLSLKSKIQIKCCNDGLHGSLCVIKYISLPSKINVKEKYFLPLNCNVNVKNNSNLNSSIIIKQNANLIGKYIIASFKQLKCNILIPEKSHLKSNIYINSNYNLKSKYNIDKVFNSNLHGNIIIPKNENLKSSIYIKNKELIIGKSSIQKAHYNDLKLMINIPLSNNLKSTINVKLKDVINANANIIKSNNKDIKSNITITSNGESYLYSNLTINANDSINAKSAIYPSSIEKIKSHIIITNNNNLKSSIIINPNVIMLDDIYINSVGKNNINSKIIISKYNQLKSYLMVNKQNKINATSRIEGYTNNSTLDSCIIINKICNNDLISKLVIPYSTNRMNADVIVVKDDIKEAIKSDIFVKYSNSLKSHVTIQASLNKLNKLNAKIDLTTRTSNNIKSNIKILTKNDIVSSIKVNNTNSFDSIFSTKINAENIIKSKLSVVNSSSIKSNIKIKNKNVLFTKANVTEYISNYKFYPIKDTFVSSKNNKYVYGKKGNLIIGNTMEENDYILLGFDITNIKKNKRLQSAILTLKSTDKNAITNIDIYECDNWQEKNCNWDNKPNINNLITNVENTDNKFKFNIDISDYISKKIEKNELVFNLCLKQNNESIGSTKEFYSRETNLSPELNVTYIKPALVNNDIKSNVTITIPDNLNISSKIIVNHFKNIKSNVDIKGKSDIKSNIIIGKKKLTANIIITKTNDLKNSIIIKSNKLNDIACKLIVGKTLLQSHLIVTNNETRKSIIFIRKSCKNDLSSNIIIIPRDNNDIVSNIRVRERLYIKGNIIISRPFIKQKISIRRAAVHDIKSTIRIFRFKGYVTIF